MCPAMLVLLKCVAPQKITTVRTLGAKPDVIPLDNNGETMPCTGLLEGWSRKPGWLHNLVWKARRTD